MTFASLDVGCGEAPMSGRELDEELALKSGAMTADVCRNLRAGTDVLSQRGREFMSRSGMTRASVESTGFVAVACAAQPAMFVEGSLAPFVKVPSCFVLIVSIFEPHTDIIIKDRRETFYGHKVCLTSGSSGLVLDLVVERGNPADSTLAQKAIERVRSVLGRAPKQVTFDGGFSSKANVQDIRAMGVEDVVFSKHVGLDITDMAKSSWVFRTLRNFRAGIEAGISFLKRTFRLGRCNWSGFDSFSAYVGQRAVLQPAGPRASPSRVARGVLPNAPSDWDVG